MIKELETEEDVKSVVKKWFDQRVSFSWAPVSNGMGVHGIPDRVGCVGIKVTPEMVGKTVGIFVGVESKRPGRRGEKHRGMSAHQVARLADINDAGGIGVCCDGHEDIALLIRRIAELTGAASE